MRGMRIICGIVLLALILCVPVLGEENEAIGVEWTGLEWNGSTEGEYPDRSCDIVEIGRESPRADSIPFDTLEDAVQGAVDYRKELSDRYMLLSQTEWKFRLYDAPALFDESADTGFYSPDYDDTEWDDIFVPSVWQTQGYDYPIYTNTTQKFARNFGNTVGYPRELPTAPEVYNPVGLYRRTFDVPQEWQEQQVYLTFEGVDSAFYVWVNGCQVGYAEDSFTTDEFNITDYIIPGQTNTLAVKVLRWCDGSWLEDQDYIDLSGIFRDVYIYAAPNATVRDFWYVTDFDDTYTDSSLTISFKAHNSGTEEQMVTVTPHLIDSDGVEVPLDSTGIALSLESGETAEASVTVEVTEPRKWSGEDPYLYTLVLEEESAQGTVYESCQLGFRKITYKQNDSGWWEGTATDHDLIRINGQPVTLHGVDRHETHPEYGYALTREVMLEDITIMLENNINAVRTSHYPNSPYWYYLCDKYGIYVMDEANLECHSNMIFENQLITENMSRSVIDREYNMVCRDRNHPSVIIWSLGNECKNPDILRTILVEPYETPWSETEVLHAFDPTRPWHYEQATDMYETGIDMKSGMYLSVEEMIEHGESDVPQPHIQCELQHAMGNSMGNFDEYWQVIDTYRNLQGGFIWDFIDQAITLTADDGTEYFAYGGDFGERVNDGNFCCNGLLLPDRTVQPEMAEVRYQYQMLKFSDADVQNGLVEMNNFFLFTDISQKYEFDWSLMRDDEVLQQGTLPADETGCPNVDSLTNQPGKTNLKIPFNKSLLAAGHEYFLNISVCLREDDGLLKAGYEIAKAQFVLEAEEESGPAVNEDSLLPALEMTEDQDNIYISSEKARVTFSKADGSITTYEAPDESGTWRDLILPGMGPKLNLYRANTDNDRAGFYVFTMQWKETGEPRIGSMTTERLNESTVCVNVESVYTQLNDLCLSLCYTVCGNGAICVRAGIVPRYDKNFVYIPAVGMEMSLPESFEQMTYFGKGPEENYIDRSNGTMVGRYTTTVTDNFVPYLESSETGNRTGVRWIALTEENGFGLLAAVVSDPIEASALHYTASE
ncbi:MAG: DUF4981 domain-containing protein, partial [Parasporobacterium sp.]|nr:DUF4981 domain-containing protein [Parasporobacterium sp.]